MNLKLKGILMENLLETTITSLPVQLTSEEVASFSQELAELTTKQATLEEEKKAVVSSFKERLDRILFESRSCDRKVTTRQDVRDIECRIVANWDNGTAETFRTDTYERISVRPLTKSEMQPNLL